MIWILLILASILLFLFFLTRNLSKGVLYVRPGVQLSKGGGDKELHLKIKGKSSIKDLPLDNIKIRLFNPRGKTTQLEMGARFPESKGDFELTVDLGPSFVKLKELHKEAHRATVQVELYSTTTGRSFSYMFPYKKFIKLVKKS